MKAILTGLFILALTLGAAPSYADNTTDSLIKTVTDQVFSSAEKRIIEDYFGIKTTTRDRDRKHGKSHGHGANRGRTAGLPPGLAKRDTLPPGLARQLDRNGALPPGLEKRDLPDDLSARLPARTRTKRVIVDKDVVLIDEATNKVLDVLENVLNGRN